MGSSYEVTPGSDSKLGQSLGKAVILNGRQLPVRILLLHIAHISLAAPSSQMLTKHNLT